MVRKCQMIVEHPITTNVIIMTTINTTIPLTHALSSPLLPQQSWEQLKRTKNYEEEAGKILFQTLFTKCPQAKPLFGFPIDIDPNSKDLLNSRRFKMHAVYMIQMLDTALNMLGPDIELLTEIMAELGVKHIRYGVRPDMFPMMGDALMATLEGTIGDSFTDNVREAWKETYGELSSDMIKAQQK